MKTKAKIVRLNESMGVGFITIEKDGAKSYPFRFDKIKDYHGEQLKELRLKGIKENAEVTVEVEDDLVQSVEPSQP